MSVLSWDRPNKSRPTDVHNKIFSSDAEVAGTYMPNMSRADMLKWKAKKIGGKDPRVEIRKTVEGRDPSHSQPKISAEMLIVVRLERVILSANGRLAFDLPTFAALHEAVEEALNALDEDTL